LAQFIQLVHLDPEHRSHTVKVYEWINAGDAHTKEGIARFTIDWGFLLDPLSSIMVLVVTGIGFLIHVYSSGYMHEEDGFYRFFAYLNLFMFSMLTLILGSNYVMMFIGWEGVGLCSYLLIGYYFLKKSAGDAAKKAFIVNRVGDWGLSIGIMLIFVSFGSLEFTKVGEVVREGAANGMYHVGDALFVTIALALFVGATGKSAQIPLFVWLPDAMEGPTPVSALIHAATMVTAGVYMVARSNWIFQLAPQAMGVVAVIGGLTALFAASIAVVQNDIKRVLAYSTVSQLGYMFLALGVGAFTAGCVSPHDPCLLQSSAVPGIRQRDSRHASRAGHAKNGGTRQEDSHHVLDNGNWHRGDCRVSRRWPVSFRRMRFCGGPSRVPMGISCSGFWVWPWQEQRRSICSACYS
jgi:NADH-quinone oxidoreductase subunit L